MGGKIDDSKKFESGGARAAAKGGMRETLGRILRLYARVLSKHKYATQIVTGGVLWCTGDLLCQGLVRLGSKNTATTSDDGGGSSNSSLGKIPLLDPKFLDRFRL